MNPTINLKELKTAMQSGDIKNVKIIETVSGKVTTVGEVFNGLTDNLEKMEIIHKKNSILGKMFSNQTSKII
jgi:predicted RNA-binding protein